MIISTAVHVWLDIGYKQTQKHTLATYRRLRSNIKKQEVGGKLVFYAQKETGKQEEKTKIPNVGYMSKIAEHNTI